MGAEWYGAARRGVLDCLSSVMSIDDRAKDPGGTTIDGVLLPDMTVDERARRVYFDQADRLRLAQRIRRLATSADWDQIVRDAEAATESARLAARSAYDLRMADAEVSEP